MSNRTDRSSGHEFDVDSTDELPVLDPAAYEASSVVVGDTLSRSDTWVTPPAAGAADLASIFDTIRSLEANLRAKSEHTDDLEQQLARVERQMRVFEKDKAVLQSQIADLEDARDGLAADVEARGTTIARLKGDLATRAEQIRAIEQQRDAVEIDKVALTDAVRAREVRIGSLESEIAARTGKLNELEGLALSHDQAGRRLKVSVSELELELEARASQLGARDERIAALETQLQHKEAARGEMAQALEQQSRHLAELDHELAGAQQQTSRCVESLQNLEARRRFHDEALFAFEQEIDLHLQQIAHLEAQLGERATEIGALQVTQRERDAVIEGLRGELQSRDVALAERMAELTKLRAITHDSGGVIADLERQIKSLAADISRVLRDLGERDVRIGGLEEELRGRASELQQREAEQTALRGTLETLQTQLGKRDTSVSELVALLQAEQKRVAALEGEATARMRAQAELTSRQRVQDEFAESQARELDNWKEKWTEVATAMGEKEARLAHAETELRVNAAELSTRIERINALQKSLEDQAETLAELERELREKAESLGRLEGDLRVAEDSMLRLESQLRQKTDQHSGMQRSLDEQRGQIRHLQDTLATRDSAVARLEGELKASNEIIGNIQRDIRRLSGDAPAAKVPQPGTEPPSVEPDPMTRLFVRLDDEGEVVHVISKKTTSIGRTDDNDIAIDTRYISRHHARILTVPNATVIEDLGSTNGVYVNDHRVSRRQSIKDGDIVMVGKTRFRFAVKFPDRSH